MNPFSGSILICFILTCIFTMLHTVSMRDGGIREKTPSRADRESSRVQRLESSRGSISLGWKAKGGGRGLHYKIVRRNADPRDSVAVVHLLESWESRAAASYCEYIDAPSGPGVYTYEIYEIPDHRGERLIGREVLQVDTPIKG